MRKHTNAATTPQPGTRAKLPAALIFVSCWLVYANSLDGQFVFDDTSIILNNPLIRSLSLLNVQHIFGSHYWQAAAGRGGLYRPLVILSYAWNYAAGNLSPFGYHFMNVLLHGMNAMLVFAIVRELFGDFAFATWSGFLFALHPIRTEAVSYVAGRAESLAALFFLAAWWCHLRRKTLLATVAFVLAALTKESALTFVAIPLITDLGLRRPLAPRRYWPYAAAAAGVLTLRYAVLGGIAPLAITASSNPLVNAGAAARILTATKVLGKYLLLLIYPVPLSADYSFNQIPLVGSPMDPWFLVSAAALAAIVAGTLWSWRRAPALFLCGAFFLVTFSLTSNLLRPIGTIMGERLLYLPSVGFTCAVAYALARAQRQARRRNLVIAAGALLALLYAGRTVARNADWKDQLALFSSAAAISPNSSLVQANLAGALLQKREFKTAVEHALASIRIEPGDPAAHMILGEASQRLGDLSRAADAYANVEKLAPGTAGGQEAARRRQSILRRLGQP